MIGPMKHAKHTNMDALVRYAKYLGYGDLHFKVDNRTGLHAIVAIHSTKRGPAIGGCRMITYDTINQAIEDALRLGYMMSYKAAIAELPHGGAKAVLIRPPFIKDRAAYFETFGEFLNELGGRYLTAVDSGTSPLEMDIIARKTTFVTCTTEGAGDASPYTALGIRRGIEAAVQYKMGKNSLEGVHVAVQGLGHVGQLLVKDLYERGARLTVTDIDTDLLNKTAALYNATPCKPDDIFDVKADVFSPNALGGALNHDTIQRLRVSIVAGGANNQLSHHRYGATLVERGILYAPDFLINAGGLIYVAMMYAHGNPEQAFTHITRIYDMLLDIFERAQRENQATNLVAREIARERLT